jgi:hypothetical protein
VTPLSFSFPVTRYITESRDGCDYTHNQTHGTFGEFGCVLQFLIGGKRNPILFIIKELDLDGTCFRDVVQCFQRFLNISEGWVVQKESAEFVVVIYFEV